MWRIARDSRTLDLNSSYAYVLYARDFADTCRIALVAGEAAGFVIGYRRPRQPDCLFIWQIAVDERFRGLGLAARMLDSVLEDAAAQPIRTLETTITDDNVSSQRLFRAFARRWGGAPVVKKPLFEREHFRPTAEGDADDHAPERLYVIGPLAPKPASAMPELSRRQ